MRERPIIMGADSVRAILAGTKSQTRRVIPASWLDANPDTETGRAVLIASCRYGVVGDRLWVRERWAAHWMYDDVKATNARSQYPDDNRWYQADGPDAPGSQGCPSEGRRGRWRPSIHMPRWASRLTLEIASVRVERVQSITEADARAEGCRVTYGGPLGTAVVADARDQFRGLWDEINGARSGCSWADDPWVFAISFRRLRPGVESAVRAQMGMEGR